MMVLPTTVIAPKMFKKFGAAKSCVLANIGTGFLVVALLIIGNLPATTALFAVFVLVFYLGTPFTTVSNLSTGPMLDVIAPVDKRGYVHGWNGAVMNFSGAIAPWLLGVLADYAGTNVAIGTSIGISFVAALINAPLMFKKGFGPSPKKLPATRRPLLGEDKEIVEKAIRGDWVPPDIIAGYNRQRQERGEPFLVMHVAPYEQDRERLDDIRAHSRQLFELRRDLNDEALIKLANEEDLAAACKRINTSYMAAKEKEIEEIKREMGQWVGEYLQRNGYPIHLDPTMVKSMMLTAFPPLLPETELEEGGDLQPSHLEAVLLRQRELYSKYINIEEEREDDLVHLLASDPTKLQYR